MGRKKKTVKEISVAVSYSSSCVHIFFFCWRKTKKKDEKKVVHLHSYIYHIHLSVYTIRCLSALSVYGSARAITATAIATVTVCYSYFIYSHIIFFFFLSLSSFSLSFHISHMLTVQCSLLAYIYTVRIIVYQNYRKFLSHFYFSFFFFPLSLPRNEFTFTIFFDMIVNISTYVHVLSNYSLFWFFFFFINFTFINCNLSDGRQNRNELKLCTYMLIVFAVARAISRVCVCECVSDSI